MQTNLRIDSTAQVAWFIFLDTTNEHQKQGRPEYLKKVPFHISLLPLRSMLDLTLPEKGQTEFRYLRQHFDNNLQGMRRNIQNVNENTRACYFLTAVLPCHLCQFRNGAAENCITPERGLASMDKRIPTFLLGPSFHEDRALCSPTDAPPYSKTTEFVASLSVIYINAIWYKMVQI